MTPKEKARELFYKMLFTDTVDDYSFVGSKVAKQCALIAVDELIKSHHAQLVDKSLTHPAEDYWQQVKQELETFKSE